MQLNYEQLLAELLIRPEKMITLQPRVYEGLLRTLLAKLKIHSSLRSRVISLLQAVNGQQSTVKIQRATSNSLVYNLTLWLEQMDVREPDHLLQEIMAVYGQAEYKRRVIVCLLNVYSIVLHHHWLESC